MILNSVLSNAKIACFSLIVLSLICAAPCPAATGAAHPEMLVSTEWLAAHLNDPKVVILQEGDDRGEYEKEHIPGTRFLRDEDFTTGHQGLMVELPAVEKLKQTF